MLQISPNEWSITHQLGDDCMSLGTFHSFEGIFHKSLHVTS